MTCVPVRRIDRENQACTTWLGNNIYCDPGRARRIASAFAELGTKLNAPTSSNAGNVHAVYNFDADEPTAQCHLHPYHAHPTVTASAEPAADSTVLNSPTEGIQNLVLQDEAQRTVISHRKRNETFAATKTTDASSALQISIPTAPKEAETIHHWQRLGKNVKQTLVSTHQGYRVMREEISQNEEKLRLLNTEDTEPPWGYTFVPVGSPTITKYCKELSFERNKKVYIVSDPKKPEGPGLEKASVHTHRIGHHFENSVVDDALAKDGYIRSHESAAGVKFCQKEPQALARRLKSFTRGLPSSIQDEDPSKQAVRLLIRDLFPHIPDRDLEIIIQRAFKHVTNPGRKKSIFSLPRRVQIAVTNHIRHTKTNYDQLLKDLYKEMSRDEAHKKARKTIEAACIQQIKEWRGEDDSVNAELEEICREVIVIDDDNDDEESDRDIIVIDDDEEVDRDIIVIEDDDNDGCAEKAKSYGRVENMSQMRPTQLQASGVLKGTVHGEKYYMLPVRPTRRVSDGMFGPIRSSRSHVHTYRPY